MLRLHTSLIEPDVRYSRILCGQQHKMRNVAPVVMWCPGERTALLLVMLVLLGAT